MRLIRRSLHLCLALPMCLAGAAASAAEPTQPSTAPPDRLAVLVVGPPAKGAPPVGGELREPFGVGMDRAGNMYIVELSGGRVLKLDVHGKITTFAGTGGKGYAGDGGPAAAATFNGMHHLVVTPDDDLLIADTWNNCVRKIDAKTGTISTIVGTGVKGFSGDGGPADRAQSGGIYCLALDVPRNRLLLVDLDNRRVRAVDLKSGTITTVAGNGQRGVPADGQPAVESPLADPRAVACDAAGNIYILERGGHALRVVDTQGRIRTLAGTGRKGPPGDDVPALEATFNGPKHLCVDNQGDILIADAENNVVSKLLRKTGRVVRVAGTGKPGAGGIDGPARSLEVARPHGVYVGRDGTIYVTDSYNNRIVKLINK